MKRIILIVTIALLPVLGACFVCRVPIHDGQVKTKLVPAVSKFGTLTNLKDDKGRSLFRKPIKEGVYIRYSVENGKEETFYVIGDRVSDPEAPYSGYQEKISGAGITTRDRLNVTSGFVIDKSNGTLSAIRTIVNLSKEKTIYLSEVKNYSDPNLRPLRTVIGVAKKVAPLDTEIGAARIVAPLDTVIGAARIVAPLHKVIGASNHALPLRTGIDIENEPSRINDNCWPCQPWPDCDLINLVLDPTKATIVCISCKEDVPGLVHTVCLADLEKEIREYEAEGCDHPIKLTGISDTRSAFDKPCPTPTPVTQAVAKYISREVAPETGQGLSEEALKQLSPSGAKYISREVTPETGQSLSGEALKQLLTLRPGTAIVIITEHKINMPRK